MMPSAIFSDPFAVLVLLVVAVAAADWLGRLKWLNRLGAAILVILFGALLANVRVIPPVGAGGPAYDPIFTYVVPGAIFLILLDVHLGALNRAGGPMLAAFGLGAVGVMAGVALAASVLPTAALGHFAGPLGGMFTGTYIGGSANFNAIAVGYGVEREGGLYLAAVVVDNVMTVLWMIALLALPTLLHRTGRFGKRAVVVNDTPSVEANEAKPIPIAGTLGIALPLALTGVALWVSIALADAFAAAGFAVPPILIVTTIALIVAQLPMTRRLTLAAPIGMWAVYLFLAAVGASADLPAVIAAQGLGLLLFGYVAIIFAVHALFLLVGGALLKLEPETIAVASVANIGGSSTAPVIAEATGREDLALPGIVVGALGNALGTYAGFAIAALIGG